MKNDQNFLTQIFRFILTIITLIQKIQIHAYCVAKYILIQKIFRNIFWNAIKPVARNQLTDNCPPLYLRNKQTKSHLVVIQTIIVQLKNKDVKLRMNSIEPKRIGKKRIKDNVNDMQSDEMKGTENRLNFGQLK